MSICLAVIYVLCISVSLCTRQRNRLMSRVKPRRLPAHNSRALHWLWSVIRELFVLLVYVNSVLTYPHTCSIVTEFAASLRKHICVRLAKQPTQTHEAHTDVTHDARSGTGAWYQDTTVRSERARTTYYDQIR